ncbi:MAG: hypothetical protein ABR881_08275 [Candidatus Sulfotelmatobacter sp.]|jgi:3-mercaptopyruvate sulfurtransferase SseA
MFPPRSRACDIKPLEAGSGLFELAGSSGQIGSELVVALRARYGTQNLVAGTFAARAYFTLDYLGHGSSTALLDGGLEKWSREFGAVRTISANVAAARLTVHPRPDLIIELPALRSIVSNHTGVLIDARPPAD